MVAQQWIGFLWKFFGLDYPFGRRTSISLSRLDIPLGDALPSGIHHWAHSKGNTEWRHSASWIRSGKISCWPTDAVLSLMHGHCILNSAVRSEVLHTNSNYTVRYPDNTEGTQCFRLGQTKKQNPRVLILVLLLWPQIWQTQHRWEPSATSPAKYPEVTHTYSSSSSLGVEIP